MFWHREDLPIDTDATQPSVSVGFTDASIDLRGQQAGFAETLASLERECGVRFARLNQVHGVRVLHVDQPTEEVFSYDLEDADALATTKRAVGLMVQAADCVPVLLADVSAGVIGAAHAGRLGVQRGVVIALTEQLHALGACNLIAWIGPHVCGGCYEVPAAMRDEVAAVVPQAFAETTWGTPSLDLGAGVAAQLAAQAISYRRISGCTREEVGLHSHRRDGAQAGRMAGLIWLN